MSTLGSGLALLAKINAALADQGLRQSTRVSAPVKSGSAGGALSSPSSVTATGAAGGSEAEEAGGGVPVAGIVGGAAALLVALAGQCSSIYDACQSHALSPKPSCLDSDPTTLEHLTR